MPALCLPSVKRTMAKNGGQKMGRGERNTEGQVTRLSFLPSLALHSFFAPHFLPWVFFPECTAVVPEDAGSHLLDTA